MQNPAIIGQAIDVAIRELERNAYLCGHKQAEKDIIALIRSRISEIIGDASPKPILRIELEEMISRIKEYYGE